MSSWRRGTTPTQPLVVDVDLTGWTCIVTIKGLGGAIDLDGDRLDLAVVEPVEEGEPTYTVVTFTLTQKETLKLKPGNAEVQIRAVRGDDPETAIATEVGIIEVGKILKDGEIHAQS